MEVNLEHVETTIEGDGMDVILGIRSILYGAHSLSLFLSRGGCPLGKGP